MIDVTLTAAECSVIAMTEPNPAAEDLATRVAYAAVAAGAGVSEDGSTPATVSLSREQWALILAHEPFRQETYTDDGIALFNAFQAIHRAVPRP